MHRFALPLLFFVTTAGAQEQGTHSHGLDVRLMPGVGGAGLVSPPLAWGVSAGLALQISRFLLLGEGLLGGERGYLTLFVGGAGGLLFGDAENIPYALIGSGILARGNGDNRGHSAVALTAEVGAALWRSRQRPGQIWFGVRGFVPLADTSASGDIVYGGVPRVPFLSINLRFWL